MGMEPQDWLECCARKTTEQLFADMRNLHRVESEMIAPILAHLSELDERDAVLPEAYPSLFVYCVRALAYSEAEAFLRIRAARAARRFPRILTMLARREIHVSAVARLAPHLTPENYRILLDRASRRTRQELQDLIAEVAPEREPERRPVIRALSVGTKPQAADVCDDGLFAVRADAEVASASQVPVPTAEDPRIEQRVEHERPKAAPIPEPEARILFNFVGRESLRRKLKRAAEVLWHKFPRGEPDLIIETALDDLLDHRDPERRIARKRKRGAGKRRPEVLT